MPLARSSQLLCVAVGAWLYIVLESVGEIVVRGGARGLGGTAMYALQLDIF